MRRLASSNISVGLAVLGAVGVPLGAALPWTLSGQVKKSMFSLARSARDLGLPRVAADMGFANENAVQALLWTLFASPLLAGLVVLLLALGKRAIVAVVLTIAGLIGIAGGAAGMIVGDGSFWGPRVTFVGGAFALVGAVGLWRARRSEPL